MQIGIIIIGIAILALMLIRLITRLASSKPPKVETGNGLIDMAGGAAHLGLYLLVFAMCLSGLALANAAGLPGIVFGGHGVLPPATVGKGRLPPVSWRGAPLGGGDSGAEEGTGAARLRPPFWSMRPQR